jgi:hypothetical protein
MPTVLLVTYFIIDTVIFKFNNVLYRECLSAVSSFKNRISVAIFKLRWVKTDDVTIQYSTYSTDCMYTISKIYLQSFIPKNYTVQYIQYGLYSQN